MNPRVAFYAPMKSPDHPNPSGDQRIARLFVEALQLAGYEVELASELRSWEGKGDRAHQKAIREQGQIEARSLIGEYQARPKSQRPAYWFTYHLFHKAPDWIGPAVSKALGIPYFVAEASVANKQKQGAWSEGWQCSVNALTVADGVLTLNPGDEPALREYVSQHRIHSITPFVSSVNTQPADRQMLAQKLGLDPDCIWLITTAMMRPGAKFQSYQRLAQSLQVVSAQTSCRWQLLVIGDGKERTQVEALFASFKAQVVFAGQRSRAEIQQWMPAFNLFVWPAINEAIGMAMLEAMAAGVPVLSGYSPALYPLSLKGEGLTMLAEGDDAGFSLAFERLLSNPQSFKKMSTANRDLTVSDCSLDAAAMQLKSVLGAMG
ncbi:glycosyltransferase family 4 protein [Aestuariirhabdus haliotis]|uniref:glycosyltransferase family 4 protein n=1 Tax=Aestuariirhabdus haliotis TaxID=2918751 RepID=UPI0020C09511|nr:glycosyltransferase family 4 protein [Aestuariirhabdus haliotis]MCL6418771.1 glycosyltransferase family 4 protein [Aestuariirhabdus haliotis]